MSCLLYGPEPSAPNTSRAKVLVTASVALSAADGDSCEYVDTAEVLPTSSCDIA